MKVFEQINHVFLPEYSVLEQAAQREVWGWKPLSDAFPPLRGLWEGAGFQEHLQPGTSLKSKPYLNAGSSFCSQGNIQVGEDVSKCRQIILSTSLLYWKGVGETHSTLCIGVHLV